MSLAGAFRAVRAEERVDDAGLEAVLARAHAEARAARADGYGTALPAERFAAHLARALGSAPDAASSAELEAALFAKNLGDLLLAAGCASGDGAALQAFDREFGGEVERAYRRAGTWSAQLDDAKQLLWTKLFVAEPGSAPKITEYAGTGPLRVWLRVVLTRLLQNLGTRGPKETLLDGETLADAAGGTLDPELERLRAQYRDAFRLAFAAAAVSVPLRERVLLHQSFALRRTQDSLATEYQVHVNTIARWLSRARERLEQAVRAELSQRLHLGEGEFTSIVRLVGAHLDVTLGRLAPPTDPPEG
jgi:RNA polymerase sigma-70 factor (ECF subfamily)